MRNLLLAAAAALPLVFAGAAAEAASFQNSTGGSMYLPAQEPPNALENSLGSSRGGALVEGRSVFESAPTPAEPRAYVAPHGYGPVLIGRSTHWGDNY